MSDNDLAVLFDRLVRRMHVLIQQKALKFDTKRIGPGGAIFLLTLDELGPSPLSQVTERIMRDKSQVTRLVRSLEEKGCLTRCMSSEDARVTLVSLTSDGKALVEAHQKAIGEAMDTILGELSSDEREIFVEMLRRAVG